MRTAWRLLSAAAAIGSSVLMYAVAFAPPAAAATATAAAAQGISGCSATLNGAPHTQFPTPKKALRVRSDQSLVVEGTALDLFFDPGATRGIAYIVKLELAGASWTVASGTSSQQSWTGTVNVADYATRGQGIYKVVAITKSLTGSECFGRAYVKVEGEGGPLSTTAGQVAAGVGLAGAAGAAAAGARGGREIDEGAVKDAVGNFLEEQGGGPPPEAPIEQDRAAAEEEIARRYDHELTLMSFCLPLVVVAAVATIRAVASDVGRHVVHALGAVGGWWLR